MKNIKKCASWLYKQLQANHSLGLITVGHEDGVENPCIIVYLNKSSNPQISYHRDKIIEFLDNLEYKLGDYEIKTRLMGQPKPCL